MSKICFCSVLSLLLDTDSIVAQAAGMKGFCTTFFSPTLRKRIDAFFFLVNYGKEHKVKRMRAVLYLSLFVTLLQLHVVEYLICNALFSGSVELAVTC